MDRHGHREVRWKIGAVGGGRRGRGLHSLPLTDPPTDPCAIMESANGTVPARGPAWKWWVCGLLLLATMINYMDRLTLNLTANRIKIDLLLSNEQYGQVEGVFGVAFALGALL